MDAIASAGSLRNESLAVALAHHELHAAVGPLQVDREEGGAREEHGGLQEGQLGSLALVPDAHQRLGCGARRAQEGRDLLAWTKGRGGG